MLVGWVDLIRRPFAKRNDFASVDARNYPKNSKTYEMITSPPTTYVIPKTPDPLVKSPRPEEQHDEGMTSPLPNSPPSPSSQYTNDYFNNNNNHNDNHTKEPGSRRSRQLSFCLPPEADYKSPKLSFSTPRPPPSSAGRSFIFPKETHHARFQFHQHQNPQMVVGRTTTTSPGPRRPFSPPQTTAAARRRESGGSSTFESASAYEWDPTTTYAPPSTGTSSRVRSPSSYYGGVEAM